MTITSAILVALLATAINLLILKAWIKREAEAHFEKALSAARNRHRQGDCSTCQLNLDMSETPLKKMEQMLDERPDRRS